MKCLLIIIFSGMVIQLSAQVNIINSTNGSLTITPNGMRGKLPISTTEDSTNISIGENALQNNINAKLNIAIGKNALKTLSYNNSGTAYQSKNIAIGYESMLLTQPTSPGSGTENTAIGHYSLRQNSTGSGNTALGLSALYNNISGRYNSALGNATLGLNTTGIENVGVGVAALLTNKANHGSVAVGHGAMQNADNRTTGIYTKNSALGYNALYGSSTPANNTGIENTALGANSMQFNTSGRSNTAVGTNSMQSNTTGSNNVAVGSNSLNDNTIGINNVAIGVDALSTNVAKYGITAVGTGAMKYANSTSTNFYVANTAFGFEAMRGSTTPANNTGDGNTGIGQNALHDITSGSLNTALGFNALVINKDGSDNVAIGTYAGEKITSGNGNVLIGYNSGGTANVSGKLFIANSNTDNPLIKGDFSTNEVKINSQLRVGGTGDAASATLQVDGNYAISGKTSMSSNQNNYNLGGKSVIKVSGGGNYTLTGIAGGVDGMIVHIYVLSSTDLTLTDDSGASSAGNKIVTGNNADLNILQGGGATLIYDGDALYWRVIGVKN
jgi:trimeric autotransporter adhesin